VVRQKIAAAMCAPLCVAAASQGASATPGACAAATPRVRAAAAFARGRYHLESRGAAVRAATAAVAADRRLAAAVGSGDLPAADSAALRLLAGRMHVTAIRVRRAGRLLLETHRYPFDVAGATAALGKATVDVTIQDVIGFIRLVRKFTGSDVVVRGTSARATLPAGLATPLPAAGCATVGGRRYAVRELDETDFDGRPLRIWVLRDRP
jgi:hypothetical protein